MSARDVDFLLVGSGLASATAAEALRIEDAQGSIEPPLVLKEAGGHCRRAPQQEQECCKPGHGRHGGEEGCIAAASARQPIRSEIAWLGRGPRLVRAPKDLA